MREKKVAHKVTTKKHPSSKSKTNKTTHKKIIKTTPVSSHKKPQNFLQKVLKIEHDLPLGIRVLTIYLTLLFSFYLIVGVALKKAMIFGIMFGGIPAFLVNALTLIIIGFLIYGFAKKEIKYYYLSTIFFGLIILNTLISIFSLRAETSGVLLTYTNYAFLLTSTLNIITFFFILSKKYYFEHPKPEYHVHKTDKIFIVSLILIWVALIGGTFYYGNQYIDQTFQSVDPLIFSLQDRGVLESLNYCTTIDDEDLCFYIAAMLNKKDINSFKLCQQIKFPIMYNECAKGVRYA